MWSSSAVGIVVDEAFVIGDVVSSVMQVVVISDRLYLLIDVGDAQIGGNSTDQKERQKTGKWRRWGYICKKH